MRKKHLALVLVIATAILAPAMIWATGKAEGGAATTSAPVELTVEVFDRSTTGQTPVDNNYWTAWIQEKFGKPNNIKVKFIPCPRSQEVAKLNVWMAANQAPDLALTYDVNLVYNYYINGGLADLTDAFNKYGAALKTYLGDLVLSRGQYYERQYAICAKRIIQGRTGNFIRKDWLDALGLPLPDTTEQFYQALVAFRDKNPGKVENVVPYALADDVWWACNGFFEAFKEPITERELYIKDRLFVPGYKEGLRYLNKLWNEGLISKEYPLDKVSSTRDADIIRGAAGAYTSNYDMMLRDVPGHYKNLKKNVPTANLVPFDPYTNKYTGKHTKELYDPSGVRIIVPKTSARVNEAIKYLNWMTDTKVLFFLQNGNEGVGHTLVNGLPKVNAVQGEQMFPSMQNIDYTLILNGVELGDMSKTVKVNSLSYPGLEALYEDCFRYAMRDGYVKPILPMPVEADAKYGVNLKEQKEKEVYAKCITAKPADFDKAWDTTIAEYLAAGGQEVMDQRAAAWDKAYPKKK
jgi:putative aldouronate transport system substrate-binding protein